jgi:hypothetical protein
MINRGLVLVALACSALVVLSFAMFARDQISGASKHQVAELASGNSVVSVVPGAVPTTTKHAQPRRFIDSAAKALTSPFRSLVSSSSQWVQHGIPTFIALLLYGLGLGYLARFTRGLQ